MTEYISFKARVELKFIKYNDKLDLKDRLGSRTPRDVDIAKKEEKNRIP